MNNFNFLKNLDKDLYNIIVDAENLYRDEYFEQSITQVRRFSEIICKKVLGNLRTNENTFDDMLATLKDKTNNSVQEKEFIEDLYFIKREGNSSVHSSVVKKDGIIALECLKKAFEIAINYAVYFKKSNDNLLRAEYDINLLITGEKSQKTLLSEKYIAKKNKTKTTKSKNNNKSSLITKKKKFSVFKFLLIISTITSIIISLLIFVLSSYL